MASESSRTPLDRLHAALAAREEKWLAAADETPLSADRSARIELEDARGFLDNCEAAKSAAQSPEEYALWHHNCEVWRARVEELESRNKALPEVPSAPGGSRLIASTDVNATAFGVAPLIDDGLPFQDTGAHVPAPAPSASSLPDHEATGATVGVGELRAEDIFPEETPDMSLEQYASLCVERALHPGQDGEVAARYRILTEQALRQLDEQWRGRFAQEGELHQRFQQAYAQYQAWLRQQRGDG